MPRGRQRYGQITSEVFASVIQAYLASDKFSKLRPETQRGYKRYLTIAGDRDTLGGVPVEQIRPALVQAFLDGLADRPAAQHKARKAFVAIEKWAIVRDLLPRPITTGTEAPDSTGGHIPWTDEQVAFAESATPPHLSRAVTLGGNTGQRGSDLVRMRWVDLETVDGRPGINVIPQKLGGRLKLWIPLTQELQSKMETWERRPGFILTKANGEPYTRPQLADAWGRERARLEPLRGLVLHGLRATAVVRLRRAGVSIPLISDMVGMSPQMVQRYCRFSDQRQNALAAVEMLEGRFPQAKVLKFPKP